MPSKLMVEIRPDAAVTAEVVVEPRAVWVTVSVPALELKGARICVARDSIRLTGPPGVAVDLLIPLPVAVEPNEFVLQERHGVLDFHLSRPCL